MRYLLPNWPEMPQLLEEESMVNLAHLFSEHDQDFELLFLRPDPWLRRTLKENGLLPEHWWSVFDAIQGINIPSGQPLDLEDLGLPADTERVFSQSQITINRFDRLYATVNAYPSGFILSMILPNGRQGKEERFYDDRGFLSYTKIFDPDNRVVMCYWFDLTGEVVMTQDKSGAITIAPNQTFRFDHKHYDDLDQVIFEELTRHVQTDQNPQMIAMAGMDQQLLKSLMVRYPVTMLVEEHLSQQERQSVIADAAQARHVISPTANFAKQLQDFLPEHVTAQIQLIPPYATRLALGASNETDETIIMWHVNGVSKERLKVIYSQLLQAMAKEERRRLLVIADSDDQVDLLRRQAGEFLAQMAGIGTDSDLFAEIKNALHALGQTEADSKITVENAQVPEPNKPSTSVTAEAMKQRQNAYQVLRKITHIKYVVKPQVNQLKQWLNISRLLVDLGDQPNLLLQIGAISTAIPQINRHETGYVMNHINGRILTRDRELKIALADYLEKLSEWNRAVVANVKLIDQHDDDQLMHLWKKVLTNG